MRWVCRKGLLCVVHLLVHLILLPLRGSVLCIRNQWLGIELFLIKLVSEGFVLGKWIDKSAM